LEQPDRMRPTRPRRRKARMKKWKDRKRRSG
jgi:hypothetical protein